MYPSYLVIATDGTWYVVSTPESHRRAETNLGTLYVIPVPEEKV